MPVIPERMIGYCISNSFVILVSISPISCDTNFTVSNSKVWEIPFYLF
jgi:hypothetical protein